MPRSETAFLRTVALLPRLPGRALAVPNRRFWLILGLITLGGAILRVQMHDFDLPWLEKADELRIWFYSRDLRGMPVPTAPEFEYNYPPLIVWFHMLLQPLGEAQGRPFAVDAILDLRRIALLFNVAGTVWVALLGRRCGGPLAGIIAAALWAFEDDFIRVGAFAIAESLILPLLVLIVLLAVHALESPRRWRLALAGTALGFLCFLGDYRMLVAVVPGVAALVWRAWHHYRPGWRRALLWSGASLALAAVAGALILARLPERFQTLAQATLSTYLWDFNAPFLFLRKSVELIHPLLLFLTVLLALLALLSRRAPDTGALSAPALLLVGVTLLLTIWAPASIRPYGQKSIVDIWPRYLMPPLLMTHMLLAALLAQLLSGFQNPRLQYLLRTAVLVCLLQFHVLPAQRLVQIYEPLPWPVIVRNWVDDHLEASNILVYQGTQRWFDPLWGGIPHRVWFNWWKVFDIRDRTLQQWIDDFHLSWAVIPLDEHQRLEKSDLGEAMLDQMLLMRDFSGPESRNGTRALLYRLWRMQHETDIRFGEHIRLTGFDLHATDPRPGTDAFAGAGTGDELAVTLYWNASATPTENYSLFLHLSALDDARPLAQVDGNPAVPVRLTQTWDRPGETLISPRFRLPLPDDLPPGDYRVTLGLYNFETGARLPVRDAQDAEPGDALDLLRLSVNDAGTVTVTETSLAGQ